MSEAVRLLRLIRNHHWQDHHPLHLPEDLRVAQERYYEEPNGPDPHVQHGQVVEQVEAFLAALDAQEGQTTEPGS